MNLSPCPFCGGTATVAETARVTATRLFFVRCEKCAASMGCSDRGWVKEQSAVDWWNRRFAIPPEVLPAFATATTDTRQVLPSTEGAA